MLLDRIKTLSKESFIYGLSGALSGVVSFILLPLYAHVLSPEDYGYLSVLSVFQMVLEITVIFGLNSALFRYYLMADSEDEKQSVLDTCAIAQLGFIVVVGALIFLLSGQISLVLFEIDTLQKAIVLVALTAFTSSLHTLVQSIIRAERKPTIYLLMQILRLLLSIALNIYFVAYRKESFMGVVMGNLIATIVSIVPFLWWISRKISLRFSGIYFLKVIAFAWPIYLSNLFFFLMSLSDRFFLNYFLSPTDVGIYSFGSKLGSIVMVGIITPFSTAVVPFVLSIAKAPDFKKTFPKILKYFFLTISYCSLVVLFFSSELVQLLAADDYAPARFVIGPVLIAYVFYGLYYTVSILLDIVEKTKISSLVIMTGAIVAIGSNLLLIPVLNIYGAVVSCVLSNGTLFLLIYVYCQRHYRLTYELRAFVRTFALIFLFILILWTIEQIPNELIGIILKGIALAAFIAALYLAGVFDAMEKQKIRATFRKLFSKNELSG
jgi:O-antigen/teichoic acid export membrane protein